MINHPPPSPSLPFPGSPPQPALGRSQDIGDWLFDPQFGRRRHRSRLLLQSHDHCLLLPPPSPRRRRRSSSARLSPTAIYPAQRQRCSRRCRCRHDLAPSSGTTRCPFDSGWIHTSTLSQYFLCQLALILFIYSYPVCILPYKRNFFFVYTQYTQNFHHVPPDAIAYSASSSIPSSLSTSSNPGVVGSQGACLRSRECERAPWGSLSRGTAILAY